MREEQQFFTEKKKEKDTARMAFLRREQLAEHRLPLPIHSPSGTGGYPSSPGALAAPSPAWPRSTSKSSPAPGSHPEGMQDLCSVQ